MLKTFYVSIVYVIAVQPSSAIQAHYDRELRLVLVKFNRYLPVFHVDLLILTFIYRQIIGSFADGKAYQYGRDYTGL